MSITYIWYPLSMLIALIVMALAFDFLNGFHDSANIVSTVISSKALPPRVALILTAIGEFLGPFLFGVAVAETIGESLLDPQAITMQVLLAALASSILWGLLTWWLGLPSSSSHALVGGLLGAAITASGFGVVQINGLSDILLSLFISPMLGFLAGYLIMKVVIGLARITHAPPSANRFFQRAQVPTSFGLALSHGTNDAQKTMGVITLGLLISGVIPEFDVPDWVILISATAIALGTSFGGWRVIRTLGGKIFQIRPAHGFSAQLAGGGVTLGASLLGGPVSTTQVMSAAIIGTGAGERFKKVRWNVGRDILIAWLLTIPICALLSALFYYLASIIQ